MEAKCSHCSNGANATPAVATPIDIQAVQIAQLAQNVEESTKDVGLSLLNIVSVCLNAMRVAETFPGVPGIKKKELVIQSITAFARKNGNDETMITMLPSFIDAAVALERGDAKIAAANVAAGCCMGFIASGGKKK